MEEIRKPSMYFEMFEPDGTVYDFDSAGNAADALCREIDTAHLREQILLYTSEESTKDFNHASMTVPTPLRVSEEALTVLIRKVAKGIADSITQAPRRRRDITAIINTARNLPELGLIRDSDGWASLARSCERYVASALISEV